MDPQELLFSPARLGPVEVRNRTVKCATFETMTPGGEVSDQLIEWHRTFAAGGVGTSTLAYCSVSPEGLTFADQIQMREEVVPGLRRFTDAIHDEGAAAAIQLGHAGWFAEPKAIGSRPIGPSAQLAPHGPTWSRAATPDDLARWRSDYERSAELAVEAGFDGIEVHVGHGYLLSQFLCPWNNRRTDEYGGSLENRVRFPREAVRAVYDAVAGRAAVWIKLNMEDGFRTGLQLHEGLQVARWFEQDGAVDAMQLTGGHTTRTPMFLMRGDTPIREMTEDDPKRFRRLAMRAGMSLLLHDYDFTEAFFLRSARQFLAEIDVPLMLLGGITRLDTMTAAIEEGFSFVALGRALIREPDLIARMQRGDIDTSLCVPCNQCMAKVGYRPTRCVFRAEPDVSPPVG